MTKLFIGQLQEMAGTIRKDIIRMIAHAASGHPGGSLGMVEVFTALYFGIMNHDPEKPDWAERDRLILSNGHICPVRYAAMAEAGYFPKSRLSSLRRLGSSLQGHPERLRLSGMETTSGPLGSGLAQACGIAYAARMDGARFRVFCVASDGEHDEGNHWEAVLFAGKNKLANLTLFVDRNGIQASGNTEDIMPLEPLVEKYQAFGWNTLTIDGHIFSSILDAVEKARGQYNQPTVIICNVIPGKGVSFMEGNYQWHAKAPNAEEAKIALKELNAK
jgi:transketolase